MNISSCPTVNDFLESTIRCPILVVGRLRFGLAYLLLPHKIMRRIGLCDSRGRN